MASNSFGSAFRLTTWGESHGPSIGALIDGCPAGLELNSEIIQKELDLRAPGRNPFVSPRKESDQVEILSGLFEGKTTGAPISLLIKNKDADSSSYEEMKHLLRPGHANFTYLEKYGIFDHRGGGRASARETACRVAAGSIAKQFLKQYDVEVFAYINEIGGIRVEPYFFSKFEPIALRNEIKKSPIFCPDNAVQEEILKLLEHVKNEGDSVGGIVEFFIPSLPKGLGEPVYQKLDAMLGFAMMSLPASKGFEIGEGFAAAAMRGSYHNDTFATIDGQIKLKKNSAGGLLGGITTGEALFGKVAFKPTSSIKKATNTVTHEGKEALMALKENARHDPCVAIRAVPVVEAMAALVIADAILLNRSAKVS